MINNNRVEPGPRSYVTCPKFGPAFRYPNIIAWSEAIQVNHTYL